MSKRLELTGQTFGYLTVIEFAYVKNGKSYWRCICSCGQEKVIAGSSLTRSNTQSCGCFQKENVTTHGSRSKNKSNSKLQKELYDRWRGMRMRCSPSFWKKKPTYTGVSYSPLWETFEGFRDTQPTGRLYEIGLVLSRIGDKGNYSPENCRWVTKRENAIEANSFRQYHYRVSNGALGVSVARENGVSSAAFYKRIKYGWSIEAACRPRSSKNI